MGIVAGYPIVGANAQSPPGDEITAELLPPAPPSVDITLDPSAPQAWEPFSILIRANGCEPNTPVAVSVRMWRWDGDAGWSQVVLSTTVDSGEYGGVLASVPMPSAYPGNWEVSVPDCAGSGDVLQFHVALPADFAFTAVPTGGAVDEGVPFSIDLAGTGCPGQVQWSAGVPGRVGGVSDGVSGLADPVDGAWHVTATGTVPLGALGAKGPDGVTIAVAAATCQVDGFVANYEPVELQLVLAPPEPPVVTPNYTG